MAVRSIFNNSGRYVGFVQNGFLYSASGDYLGFIRSDNQVFSKNGEFVGYLLDDDRIVRKTNELPKLPLIPPISPLPPIPPIPPLNRFAYPLLPWGYEDVFQDSTTFSKTRQSTDFSRFEGMFLIASDETFLGKVSRNKYDHESIANKYGYGSRYRSDSIFNNYGKYGGRYGKYSPFNPYSTQPPFIRDGTQNIAVLTANRYLMDRLERVNPESLLLWLGHLVTK